MMRMDDILISYALKKKIINLSEIDNLLEAVDEIRLEDEKFINDLKEEIRQCDNKYIDKLNDIEKEKELSKKTYSLLTKLKKVINTFAGVNGLLAVGSAMVALDTKGKARFISGIISAALLTISALCCKLLDMQSQNTKKIKEKNDKVVNLIKDVIKDIDIIARNTNLPENIRNKAIDDKMRLKNKIDKYLDKDKYTNKYIIADVKVNGKEIDIWFSEEDYLRNKVYYDKVLHKFDSQYKQIISKLKQMISNDKRNDIRNELAKSNDSVWDFYALGKDDSGEIYLFGDLDNQYLTDYYISLYVYYDKSGKFTYYYSGLR